MTLLVHYFLPFLTHIPLSLFPLNSTFLSNSIFQFTFVPFPVFPPRLPVPNSTCDYPGCPQLTCTLLPRCFSSFLSLYQPLPFPVCSSVLYLRLYLCFPPSFPTTLSTCPLLFFLPLYLVPRLYLSIPIPLSFLSSTPVLSSPSYSALYPFPPAVPRLSSPHGNRSRLQVTIPGTGSAFQVLEWP